jgi:serine/threonine protein kinase
MPETINGYQIVNKVAETNTAEIYYALRLADRGRGGEYALKVLRPEFARDAEQRGYLENEFRICQALEHPNLLRVYGVELGGGRPFLVMEYIQGESLRDILARGVPPVRQAIVWLAQVADGLVYLHDRGFLHRDVKPQNIVVGKDEIVRVIDFALAHAFDGSFGRYLLRRLTERRRPGTWSYMAPEQIRNRRLTGQTDVYGLGATAFEVLTGRVPFSGATPQSLMEQHLHATVPPVRLHRPEVPMEVDELVRGMMAKNPLDRPMGMGYVSMKLRKAAEAL